MDTIKKILHPKTTTSEDPTSATAADPNMDHHEHHHQQQTPTNKEPFPHEVHRDRLNRKAGFDPTSTETPQPRAGHHHPRQPVGATGPPPNHQPRAHFAPTNSSDENRRHRQEEELLGAANNSNRQGNQAAEEGNNFPGTNPHPAHSALGNQSMTGERGTLMPGRE